MQSEEDGCATFGSLSDRKKRGILPLELDPSMSALFARFDPVSISPGNFVGTKPMLTITQCDDAN